MQFRCASRQCLLVIVFLPVAFFGLFAQDLKVSNLRRLPGPPPAVIPDTHSAPAEGSIRIDGKLDEASWRKGNWNDQFRNYTNGAPAIDKTRFCVLFDVKKNRIYVGAEMMDSSMSDFRGRGEERAKQPRDNWPGECVEFFLAPKCDGKQYYQFAVGPRGTKPFPNGNLNVYDANDSESKAWNGQWKAAGQKLADRWTLEIELDASSLGGATVKPGEVWAMNFCRENYFARERKLTTEFQSWAPVLSGFRDVPRFGRLVFGEEASAGHASRLRLPYEVKLYPDRETYDGQYETAEVVLFIPVAPPKGSQIQLELASVDGERGFTMLPVEDTGYIAVEVDISGLPEGVYQWSAKLKDAAGKTLAAAERPMTRVGTSGINEVNLPVRVPLKLFRLGGADGGFTGTFPIFTGLPLPRGLVSDPEQVTIFQGRKRIHVQKFIRQSWDRGRSIRWLGLDFMAEYENGVAAEYVVEVVRKPTSTKIRNPLKVNSENGVVEITTGPARFRWTAAGKGLPDAAWFDSNGNGKFSDDEQVIQAGSDDGAYWVATSVDGGRCDLTGDLAFSIEESGPLKAVLRVDGWYEGRRKKERNCRATLRFTAFAGQAYLNIDHTFVITFDDRKEKIRDIGLRLGVPGVSGGSFAHLDGTPISRSASSKACYLNQRWWNEFMVMDEGAKQVQVKPWQSSPLVQVGTKSLGLVSVVSPRARVTMALRDAWQLYPKEFGFDEKGISVHPWPKHALGFTGSWDYQARNELDPDNIWKLWYAHRQSGYGLSLSFPQTYFDRIKQEMEKSPGQGNAESYAAVGLQSNAHGIAIHNEMLLALGPPDSPVEEAARLAGVFQENPHGIPDPQWIAQSGAIWPFSPQNTKDFPRLESLMDSAWNWFYDSICARNGDYGMFNFLDGHTYNGPAAATKQVWHRIWLNNHYDHAYMLWLLYARSGEKGYFRMARRHARHVANIDTCHESSKPGEFLYQHVPGGVFHCKGFHHWGGTSQLWDHMVCPDYQLLNYYLTGDRRYWDTFNEWRKSLTKLHTQPTWGRNGIYMLKAFTDAYDATGDPILLAHRWDQADHTVKLPFKDQHAMAFQPTVYPEYLRSVGDSAMRKRFLEYVDDLMAGKAHGTWPPYAFFTGAWQLTGNRKYIEHNAKLIAENLPKWQDRFVSMHLNMTPGLVSSLEALRQAGFTEEDIFKLQKVEK
jgi:hypothetical protein